MTTQTELEKTQLEIARLQLEQERHKLAQMQKRQKVVSELGQGAVAVGGVAVKGSKAVLQYIGRWLLWAVIVETAVVVVFSAFALSSPSGNGFLWDLGWQLGRVHAQNIAAVLLSATVVASTPIDRVGWWPASRFAAFLAFGVFFVWSPAAGRI